MHRKPFGERQRKEEIVFGGLQKFCIFLSIGTTSGCIRIRSILISLFSYFGDTVGLGMYTKNAATNNSLSNQVKIEFVVLGTKDMMRGKNICGQLRPISSIIIERP